MKLIGPLTLTLLTLGLGMATSSGADSETACQPGSPCLGAARSQRGRGSSSCGCQSKSCQGCETRSCQRCAARGNAPEKLVLTPFGLRPQSSVPALPAPFGAYDPKAYSADCYVVTPFGLQPRASVYGPAATPAHCAGSRTGQH
jgi:hypothetical protein